MTQLHRNYTKHFDALDEIVGAAGMIRCGVNTMKIPKIRTPKNKTQVCRLVMADLLLCASLDCDYLYKGLDMTVQPFDKDTASRFFTSTEDKSKLDIKGQTVCISLEEMAKNVQDKVEADKVEIFQSRSKVRIIIEKKGDVDVTGPKVQQIVNLLTANQ